MYVIYTFYHMYIIAKRGVQWTSLQKITSHKTPMRKIHPCLTPPRWIIAQRRISLWKLSLILCSNHNCNPLHLAFVKQINYPIELNLMQLVTWNWYILLVHSIIGILSGMVSTMVPEMDNCSWLCFLSCLIFYLII